MKMKKLIAAGLVAAMSLSLVACGGGKKASDDTKSTDTAEGSADAGYVAMITDTGGINDQSFNQSAWEGLQSLSKNAGCKVNYIESKQASDFVTNFDQLASDGATLLWGIGFACADGVKEAAEANPDLSYAIVDNGNDGMSSNVTGVMFKAQEPSFMVGYVAALTTESNKVGFVGGIQSDLIDQFQYGFQAGVAYGAKEAGKDVTVDVQYAESFSDSAKGKAIAQKMYSDGCDVVYHAAGGTGQGVIDAAVDADKWVIGVDRDQAYLAPKNVLTSALKLVGKAVEEVSQEFLDGKDISNQTLTFGLAEDCVGIPEDYTNMGQDTYDKTMKLADEIKAGTITPPGSKADFDKFVSSL